MSTGKKWFFLLNNQVQGPLSDVDIQSLAQQHPQGLVWGQGMNDWVKPDEWQKTLLTLKDILSSLQTDMTPQWRVKQGTFEAGPFLYEQLLELLKTHPNPSEVMIYQENSGVWKNIYSYPTIVEEVGITRRSHLRVPISGLYRYEKNGKKYDSLLATISEGGLGILEALDLAVGDKVKGTVESPQLPMPLVCTCEALYKQEDGSWGMRFVNLPLESQSLIIEYSQKFNSKKAAAG